MILNRLFRPVSRLTQKSVRTYHKDVIPVRLGNMDELPVPSGSWQELYDKKQKRYNLTLVAGVVMLISTFTIAKTSGALYLNWSPPEGVDYPKNDYSGK
ncbi:cytochrome c oxidase subunit 7B [Cotesia typhae]|uniref:cytochrome c oxidase subunit 7B n=1 Tax=Cotesia typhae TaxID=2053667 RepID=UPI003D69CB5B